jgi:hypothetical protein
MYSKRCLAVLLALLLLTAALPAFQSDILCSQALVTIGTGPVSQCVPSQPISTDVWFTFGLLYTQPYTTSPYVYQSLGHQNTGGSSGICGWPFGNLGPDGGATVDLQGSGPSFASYTHVIRPYVDTWYYVNYIPPVIATTRTYLSTVSAGAKACCR